VFGVGWVEIESTGTKPEAEFVASAAVRVNKVLNKHAQKKGDWTTGWKLSVAHHVPEGVFTAAVSSEPLMS